MGGFSAQFAAFALPPSLVAAKPCGRSSPGRAMDFDVDWNGEAERVTVVDSAQAAERIIGSVVRPASHALLALIPNGGRRDRWLWCSWQLSPCVSSAYFLRFRFMTVLL